MSSTRTSVSYVGEGIYTLYSIVKGHIVTFINLFRKKVTVMYPEQKLDLPDGYRGIPCLPVDPETGKDLCIGCGACARTCPTQLIVVEAHMDENKKRIVDRFEINAGLCMFCGFCEEVCPTKAIVMSKEYELADFTRESLIYDRERLNRIGGMMEPQPEPEPEAETAAAGKEGR